MSTRFLLLALALPLAACGGDEAAETTVVTETPAVEAPMEADPMAADPMAADPMAADPMASDVTVDGTIAAAGTDLTALAPAAAVENIDGWIAKLEGDQFADVRANLTELKAQLTATPLDGAAIGATLTELGEQTTASAAGASSSSQEGLRTLGGALSATGARLTGSPAM